MLKELLIILESATPSAENLVKELISPRGTKVYEYEIEPDFIDITVDHDMPEHAHRVGVIKSKFGKLISKFAVLLSDRMSSSTARQYYVTLKTKLTPEEVSKLSKTLEKATKWRK